MPTDGLPGGIEAAACQLEVLDELQNGLHSQGQVSPVRVESLFGKHTRCFMRTMSDGICQQAIKIPLSELVALTS